jgi:hypothetical protein
MKNAYLALCVVIGLSSVSNAAPPKGFEGQILTDVHNGKIAQTVVNDGNTEYQIYLRGFINGATAQDYIKLISATDEYHHLVPNLIANSTASELVGGTLYGYQLDVVVHYGPLPITLYANVTRRTAVSDAETKISYAYTFQGFEATMQPLQETTRVLVDPERPADGIYIEDFVDIQMKKAPSNARVMKSELSKTYLNLLSAFKKRLDG